MKKITKLIFLLTLVTSSESSYGAALQIPKEASPSKYFFHQQVNDICMMTPMLNLERLDYLVNKYGPDFNTKPEVIAKNAYTRQQWFGENHRFVRAYRESFHTAYTSSGPLNTYLREAIEHGPIFPHFYTIDGQPAFGTKDTEKLKTGITAPFFFVNRVDSRVSPKLAKLVNIFEFNKSLRVPLVAKSKRYKIYSPSDKQYHFIQKTEDLTGQPPILTEVSELKEDKFQNLASLPDFLHCFAWGGKKLLGFDYDFRCVTLSGDMVFGPWSFYPYCLGLYKLMLLKLGLNNKNEEIRDGENLYDVHKNLKELVDKENNPWAEKYFTKERFLQYAITEILKKDPDLFEQAKQTADFFLPHWQSFEIFTSKYNQYYKAPGIPYDVEKVKNFLPGNEQALAYFITNNIRILLYDATSTNALAFYKMIGKERTYADTFLERLGWSNGFEKIKLAAREQKTILIKNTPQQTSFIDTWKIIVQRLKQQYERKNWISFDGHGWVASFDENIVAKQNNRPDVDTNFLNELGVAIIESWLSQHLNCFYKIIPE